MNNNPETQNPLNLKTKPKTPLNHIRPFQNPLNPKPKPETTQDSWRWSGLTPPPDPGTMVPEPWFWGREKHKKKREKKHQQQTRNLKRRRAAGAGAVLSYPGRELMAPKTDRTTRISSGVASPVITNHAAKGSVFVNLRNTGNLKNCPTRRRDAGAGAVLAYPGGGGVRPGVCGSVSTLTCFERYVTKFAPHKALKLIL